MKEKPEKITILDCTLRDGSYAIDYQFTAQDTAIIAAGLEQAGFEFIEIGHGFGLNASNSGKGTAAASDEEYLEAASQALKKAKFGMFFIPGIGRKEDLELAAQYGADFVRIGTNITEVDTSDEYVKLAKKLGMTVSSNLMKSYALPPKDFLKQAKKVEKYGADIVSVVDSAGGMLPQDVKEYVSILRDNISIPIGYHGHNNLMLAVSNTLEAISAGATVVDASLQGMGRSAGNTQTEILVLLLERLGYFTGIDIYRTMNLAEKIVKPLMRIKTGIDSISATAGYAQFHSSFLTTVYKAAQKFHVDPRELMIKVSEIDRVNVSEELAEAIGKEIEKEKKEGLTTKYIWDFSPKPGKTSETKEDVGKIANKLAKEIFSLAKKTGKYSVFTIAGSQNPRKLVSSFPFIRQNSLCIIGNAEITGIDDAKEIARNIDGFVDIVLVNIECGQKYEGMLEMIGEVVKKSKLLTYNDGDSMVNAIDSLIVQMIPEINIRKISIISDEKIGYRLALKLAERGARVVMWEKEAKRLEKMTDALNMVLPEKRIFAGSDLIDTCRGANILICTIPAPSLINTEMLKVMSGNGIVIDAGINTINPDAVEFGVSHGFGLYRLDMRAGLSGEITNVVETMELVNKIMGTEYYGDVRVVAGGILGKKGDIVVDSISNPTKVIGVADGKGGMIRGEDTGKYQTKILKVKTEMMERKLLTNSLE